MYNETFPLIIAPIYRRRIVIDVTTRRGTQLFRAKSDSPRRRALSFHSPGVVNKWISKDLSCDALIHFNAHAYIHVCTHVSDARTIYIMLVVLPNFAEVKVLQQQNMLNVHHMHTWVCTVFKWKYEQHLYTHTLILIIKWYASTNKPIRFFI